MMNTNTKPNNNRNYPGKRPARKPVKTEAKAPEEEIPEVKFRFKAEFLIGQRYKRTKTGVFEFSARVKTIKEAAESAPMVVMKTWTTEPEDVTVLEITALDENGEPFDLDAKLAESKVGAEEKKD